MGKKAKSTKGVLRAKERKLDKSTLPPPPKAVTDEVRNESPFLVLKSDTLQHRVAVVS